MEKHLPRQSFRGKEEKKIFCRCSSLGLILIVEYHLKRLKIDAGSLICQLHLHIKLSAIRNNSQSSGSFFAWRLSLKREDLQNGCCVCFLKYFQKQIKAVKIVPECFLGERVCWRSEQRNVFG